MTFTVCWSYLHKAELQSEQNKVSNNNSGSLKSFLDSSKSFGFLTWQQRVDSLSVVFGHLVDECLSMEVNTLKVFGGTHIDQVPVNKLLGVHPQAFKAVYYSIDSYRNNRQENTICLLLAGH